MNKKFIIFLISSSLLVGSFLGAYARNTKNTTINDPVLHAKRLIDSAAGDQSKLSEASDILRKIIDENPENLSALFLQGRTQQQRGLIDLALQSYQKFFKNKVSLDFASNYNVAELFELKGDLSGAERHFLMCVTIAPSEASGWERLIMILIKQKQFDKAKSYYQSLLSTLPNSDAAKRLSTIVPR